MATDTSQDDALGAIAELRNKRSKRAIFWDLLVIRLVNALWLATFFQPDEFFQALEPAWRIAFGQDSGAWLTWVCVLRASPICDICDERLTRAGMAIPAEVVAPPHAVCRAVHCRGPTSEVGAFRIPRETTAPPRGTQGRPGRVCRGGRLVYLAIGRPDVQSRQQHGSVCGMGFSPPSPYSVIRLLLLNSSQLFMTMFNPWHWYCSTRTFSNSLEMTLTVAALYYWPWELHASPKTEKENAKPRPALQAPGALRR